jgi:alkylation response protein AidB-like acyl-CoA dehydrogenase
MDFELNKEQKAIQKAARDFAEGEFTKEYALECEENHRFPAEAHKKACRLGLLSMHDPEEFGGQGYGMLEYILVIEALCRKDPGLGTALNAASFGSQFIVKFGTEEQKRAILPSVTAGEWLMGAAITEPDHGSDITDIDTTAVREGDDYVINGVKIFITNAAYAKAIVFLCKTNPDASPAYRGMSTILIEMDRPGVEVTDVGSKMGLRVQFTGEVALKDVRVPVSNLIGEENRGFHQTMTFFNGARLGVAARALGGAQAAFDRALSYSKQRRLHGRRLADFQVTQHKLADMATKIEAARFLLYRAACSYDRGTMQPYEVSMAKLSAARAAVEVADEAIQIFGGYGYMTENEVERIYRDVRVYGIYEGTNEVQKNVIASHLVGKD